MTIQESITKTFRSIHALIGNDEFTQLMSQAISQAGDQKMATIENRFCDLLKETPATLRFPFLPELGQYNRMIAMTQRNPNTSGMSVDELTKLPLNEDTVMYISQDYQMMTSEYDLFEIQKAILNNYIIETDRRTARFFVFAKFRDQVQVGSFPMDLKPTFERLVKGESILRALTFDPTNPGLNIQPLITFLAQFQLIKSIQIQSHQSASL